MASLEFLPAAHIEYQEAYWYYRERSVKAAQGLEKAMEEAVNRILDDPQTWPLWDDEFHYITLGKYPYTVFYREKVDLVEIVAVAHARRRPDYWKERLGNSGAE